MNRLYDGTRRESDGIAYDGSDGIITTAMARIYDGNNQALRREYTTATTATTRREWLEYTTAATALSRRQWLEYTTGITRLYDGNIRRHDMTAFRRWLIFRRYTTAYDGIAYDGSDGIITTGV